MGLHFLLGVFLTLLGLFGDHVGRAESNADGLFAEVVVDEHLGLGVLVEHAHVEFREGLLVIAEGVVLPAEFVVGVAEVIEEDGTGVVVITSRYKGWNTWS